jgi:hypothetical protein
LPQFLTVGVVDDRPVPWELVDWNSVYADYANADGVFLEPYATRRITPCFVAQDRLLERIWWYLGIGVRRERF